MLRTVFDYLGQSALLTLEQLLIVFGPVLALALILHRLSDQVRRRSAGLFGADFYTYLTAPGVMVHEVGHAFFCVLFGHRIVSMRLFRPGRDGTLGYVEHSWNRRNLYQSVGNFFIGTGPIWFGSALIYLLTAWLLGSRVTTPGQGIAPRPGESPWEVIAARAAGGCLGAEPVLAAPAALAAGDLEVLALRLARLLHRQPRHPRARRTSKGPRGASSRWCSGCWRSTC